MRNNSVKYLVVIAIAIILCNIVLINGSSIIENVEFEEYFRNAINFLLNFMQVITFIIVCAMLYFGFFERKRIRKRYKALLLLSVLVVNILLTLWNLQTIIVIMTDVISAYKTENVEFYGPGTFYNIQIILGIMGSVMMIVVLFINFVLLCLNKLSRKIMITSILIVTVIICSINLIESLYSIIEYGNGIGGLIIECIITLQSIVGVIAIGFLYFPKKIYTKLFIMLYMISSIVYYVFILIRSHNYYSTLKVVSYLDIIFGLVLLLIGLIIFKEESDEQINKIEME